MHDWRWHDVARLRGRRGKQCVRDNHYSVGSDNRTVRKGCKSLESDRAWQPQRTSRGTKGLADEKGGVEHIPSVRIQLTVPYSTVRYSTVHCSTIQHRTAQYCIVQQYSTVQHSRVQRSTLQHITVQFSTLHYIIILHSIAKQICPTIIRE